mgnify:CR=1 FL=1
MWHGRRSDFSSTANRSSPLPAKADFLPVIIDYLAQMSDLCDDISKAVAERKPVRRQPILFNVTNAHAYLLGALHLANKGDNDDDDQSSGVPIDDPCPLHSQ